MFLMYLFIYLHGKKGPSAIVELGKNNGQSAYLYTFLKLEMESDNPEHSEVGMDCRQSGLDSWLEMSTPFW